MSYPKNDEEAISQVERLIKDAEEHGYGDAESAHGSEDDLLFYVVEQVPSGRNDPALLSLAQRLTDLDSIERTRWYA